MLLWIRTQDKKSLLNVKEVTVDKKKITGVVGTASLDDWSKVIGKYDSEKRALEILDEMFTKLAEHTDTAVTFTMPEE
ncbi:MAG TPA: hypothetical protein VK108_05480 [Pseudogracilibacillus sp.]|nr:hypothetical protein [Pseudogracilibacillus sp.]